MDEHLNMLETDASLSVHHLNSVLFYSVTSISGAFMGVGAAQVRLSQILSAYVCVLMPKKKKQQQQEVVL